MFCFVFFSGSSYCNKSYLMKKKILRIAHSNSFILPYKALQHKVTSDCKRRLDSSGIFIYL